MPFAQVTWINQWLQRAEYVLPLVAGLLSIAILFGCAIATWIAPSEEEDDLFHREVV
jgi:hypothetical protein